MNLSAFETTEPEVSIVIPVYNEEGILVSSLTELVEELSSLELSYELIVAENGSTDQTVALAEVWLGTLKSVWWYWWANYGKALREGIFLARGTFVICDEIDLCDVNFYRVALEEREWIRIGRQFKTSAGRA